MFGQAHHDVAGKGPWSSDSRVARDEEAPPVCKRSSITGIDPGSDVVPRELNILIDCPQTTKPLAIDVR